jgi:hypothetical protein
MGKTIPALSILTKIFYSLAIGLEEHPFLQYHHWSHVLMSCFPVKAI